MTRELVTCFVRLWRQLLLVLALPQKEQVWRKQQLGTLQPNRWNYCKPFCRFSTLQALPLSKFGFGDHRRLRHDGTECWKDGQVVDGWGVRMGYRGGNDTAGWEGARGWWMSGWPCGNGCNYGQRRFRDHGLIIIEIAVQEAENQLLIH